MMVRHSRQKIQDVYIRVCRDSGWGLDVVTAAQITGAILTISTLETWVSIGSLDIMTSIAKGEHPVCKMKDAPGEQSAG